MLFQAAAFDARTAHQELFMSQDPVSPQDAAGDANPSANPAEGEQAQAQNGEAGNAAPLTLEQQLQQALALWNNAFSLRQAEHWAESLQARGGDSSESWKEVGWWAWGRPLTDTEQQEWTRYAQKHGLANACRLIFNSNEFLFVP